MILVQYIMLDACLYCRINSEYTDMGIINKIIELVKKHNNICIIVVHNNVGPL